MPRIVRHLAALPTASVGGLSHWIDQLQPVARDVQLVACDEPCLKEASTEATSKEEASKEAASKEPTSKEKTSKEAASKEVASKEAASKDAASMDATSTEADSKKQASKEAASKEKASKDDASKEDASKEATSKEEHDRNTGHCPVFRVWPGNVPELLMRNGEYNCLFGFWPVSGRTWPRDPFPRVGFAKMVQNAPKIRPGAQF